MNVKKKIVDITPFVCAIVFIILAYFGYAHPGWMVFLLIPIVPFLVGIKRIRFNYAFLVAVIYVLIGFFTDWSWRWHPGWIIFLTIPIYNILVTPKNEKSSLDNKENNYSKDDSF
ncbi:MAG: hypothetical protein PHO86_03145 [Bacilli bacterium]|nr:hypothetical protein [Bacilli bacterium]